MFSAAADLSLTSTKDVIGIYEDNEELKIAINDLINAGFDSSHFGLVACRNAVRKQLEETYREVPASHPTPSYQVEFVGHRSPEPNVSLPLGGLGSLEPSHSDSDESDVVASRSILASAAYTNITGGIKSFSRGIEAVKNSVNPAITSTPSSLEPIAKALVDDRLLLMVSERNGRMSVAKEVLEFGDSVDEGIIEIRHAIV